MPNQSSIPAWKIPWTEEPGGLQFMGCKESDTAEQLSLKQEDQQTRISCPDPATHYISVPKLYCSPLCFRKG